MPEHFRHRFLQALLAAKLISKNKVTDLLSWEHQGLHIDSGAEIPDAPPISANLSARVMVSKGKMRDRRPGGSSESS